MKSSFRATSPQDSSALLEFLARAFDTTSSATFLDPALIAWKYWSRRDDWTGPRSYILERDGAIVAHAGLWPIVFDGPDGPRGIQMIDWASAKDSPGAGLALVQKLAGLFDFVYSIGGSEATRKVLPAFGFVELTRQWKGVRPLRPLQQILTHQDRSWKLAPRFARNLLRAARRRSLPLPWTVQPVEPQDILPAPCTASPSKAGASPRSPAFFEYLSRCPAASVHFYRIVSAAGPEGHFALSVLRGQARIAGFWLTKRTEPAWVTAHLLAVQAALGLPGANELVTTGSNAVWEHSPTRRAAKQAGFHTMPGAPVFLLDKKKKLDLAPDFQFQLSDDDAFFFDEGCTGYWS